LKSISVILPVYNQAAYVAWAIDSVVAQTYVEWQLLIVNDGSTDDSLRICRKFNDPRIQIIEINHLGVSAARNAGMRVATGEYLAFLDADDVWLPNKLMKHVQHLEQAPTVGVSYSASALIDSIGNQLPRVSRQFCSHVDPAIVLLANPLMNGSSAVMRKQVALDFALGEGCFFDQSLNQGEDLEFWIRCLCKTQWEIRGLEEPLTLYRIHSDSASSGFVRKIEEYSKMLKQINAYAPEFIRRWKKPALAHFFLYIARRAVRMGDGRMAVRFVNKSIRIHWHPYVFDSKVAFIAVGAAYLRFCLPGRIYAYIEKTFSGLVFKLRSNR
jgi:glycosyltransferase involved in cell wall biosynthesis